MDLTLFELGTRMRPASHKSTASTATRSQSQSKTKPRSGEVEAAINVQDDPCHKCVANQE
jgi:hypothetical protein